MKKFLSLLALILMFNSCDDGELTVDDINFGDAVPKSCGSNGILYKLNQNEVLILVIPEDQDAFNNVVGLETFAINTENQVRYRLYNGAVGVDNICATIQPGTPQITEEWIATSGSIVINTTAVLSTPDSETGATTVLKYNHEINFINTVFAKSDGSTLIYAEIPFGDYTTTTNTLPFDFNPDNVEKCDTDNTIYNVAEISGQESLVIKIDPTLIDGTLGLKSGVIGTTINTVVYQSYNNTLPLFPSEYFCVTPTPITPLVNEKWTANVGDVTTGTGIINIFTEDDGNGGFKHTITLQKVTFYDAISKSSFYYGNEVLYGYLRTK